MTFVDLIVLLLAAGAVCWFFYSRRQKPKPHRYASDAEASADEKQT